MAKQSELPTAPAVDLENGSFSNSVNRVFESMQVIVNPAAEISKEELADIEAFIGEHFDHCEVEVTLGQQPVYSFIFGIE